jgi:hypothetical protein
VTLTALFGPEHGIRGEVDEEFGDGIDAKTGLPVYSLYEGQRREPKPEQLAESTRSSSIFRMSGRGFTRICPRSDTAW